MQCVNEDCKHPKTKVEETRTTPEIVYRVRICPKCRWRVTTTEVIPEVQSIPFAIRKPKPKSKQLKTTAV